MSALKRIDMAELEEIMEALRRKRSLKRQLTKDPYLHLRPHAAAILAAASGKKTSKSLLQDFCLTELGLDVSRDTLYRFVIREIGYWPHDGEERDHG